jgi:hypothetical protein
MEDDAAWPVLRTNACRSRHSPCGCVLVHQQGKIEAKLAVVVSPEASLNAEARIKHAIGQSRPF